MQDGSSCWTGGNSGGTGPQIQINIIQEAVDKFTEEEKVVDVDNLRPQREYTFRVMQVTNRKASSSSSSSSSIYIGKPSEELKIKTISLEEELEAIYQKQQSLSRDAPFLEPDLQNFYATPGHWVLVNGNIFLLLFALLNTCYSKKYKVFILCYFIFIFPTAGSGSNTAKMDDFDYISGIGLGGMSGKSGNPGFCAVYEYNPRSNRPYHSKKLFYSGATVHLSLIHISEPTRPY